MYIYIYIERERERERPGAIAVRGICQTRLDSVPQPRPGCRRELLHWAYVEGSLGLKLGSDWMV